MEVFRPVIDAVIVVAFGKILPRQLLEFGRFGAINVHASLLPRYRGAAPVQWAIVRGDTVTGVSIMQMDEGLDTGPVLEQCLVPIDECDTAETLAEKLADRGAALLLDVLQRYPTIQVVPQDGKNSTYAPMIQKRDGAIAWDKAAVEISRAIRGFYPWPCAFTHWEYGEVKIITAHPHERMAAAVPGTVIDVSRSQFTVACGTGVLEVKRIQPSGRNVMDVADFLNGRRVRVGMRFQPLPSSNLSSAD